uniref:Uncharacterized protein n=1 Tax=Vitrella brassicaformis TaxID=1169539 RepID=A0A7S1JWC6_9ALVE|mmetsp:Transcript_28080/g.70123  ORF Transcript_28080/g.70123 Transcript_28080/m.70123 type:complete len:120 (+) Transcript_28080:473-832(+)
MQGGGSALRAACYLAKLMPQVNEVGVYYSAPAGEVLGLLKAVGSGRKLARVHLYVDELGEGEAGLQWGDEWDLLPEIHHLEVFIEEGGRGAAAGDSWRHPAAAPRPRHRGRRQLQHRHG